MLRRSTPKLRTLLPAGLEQKAAPRSRRLHGLAWLSTVALLASACSQSPADDAATDEAAATDPAPRFAYIPLQGAEQVVVVDLETRKEVARVATDGRSIDTRITPDLTKVYAINVFNPKVSVIRAMCPADETAWTDAERAAGKCVPNSRLGTITVEDKGAYYFSISRDGKRMYLVSDTAVNEIDTATDKILRRIKIPAGTIAVEADPDGKRLWLGGASGTIQAIDVATGEPVGKMAKVDPAPATFKLSPDGAWIYTVSIPTDLSKGTFNVARDKSATVQVVDARTMELVATNSVGIGSMILGLEVATDGSQVWSANGNNTITLIDGKTHKIVRTITTDFDAAEAVELTPDGKLLLAVGHLGSLDPTNPPADRQAYGQFYSTQTFEKVGEPIDLGKTSGGIPVISPH